MPESHWCGVPFPGLPGSVVTLRSSWLLPLLPPGPSLFATFDFVRNPFRFLDGCARRYGDWFTVRVPGVSPFVFTSDPAAVREVFLGDPDALHAGEANRPLGAFMGERSSLFLDGAEHLRQRRLLLPAFHGEQMASHAGGDARGGRQCDRVVADWAAVPDSSADARDHFRNDHPHGFRISRTTPPAPSCATLMRQLFALYSSRLGTLFSLPAMRIDAGRCSPWGRAVRLTRRIDSILFAEFARRRKRRRRGPRRRPLDAAGGALRRRSSRYPISVIRDEMYTLMLAGHETTAATMAWVINRLVTRPGRDGTRARRSRLRY